MKNLCSLPKLICSTLHGKHCNRGFTVIELLVVSVFIIALSAVAVPTVSRVADKFGGNRAMNELIIEIHATRSLAIRHGRNATISFDDPAVGQYTITWGSPQQQRTGNLADFRGSIAFNNMPPLPPSPPVAQIEFAPTGLTEINPPGGGNVYLTDSVDNEEFCIEVTLAGAISEMTYIPDANQWIYK